MRKLYIVRLHEEERAQLQALVRKGRAAAYKLTHARVLLKADQGASGRRVTDQVVAAAVDVGLSTVARLRQRFVEEGLEAALRRKPQAHPSRQRVLDGKGEAALVAVACSKPPAGRERWTLRLLGDRLVELDIVDSISYETVRQTLKKTR
jgi:transposase